ncbi:DUF2917 domain-containing protein [Cupriavidus sp. a3]|uniref:DUF2917 domain-containing protein n=1 Tax=Cupriavidus sp. a3 TaxID=3242158 RepID=UPI003D9C38C2
MADPGEHVAVRCTEGELWLIRDGDPKDTSLAASESFTVPEAGTVDLYAITRASVRVTRCRTGAAGARGWRHWLARFLPMQRTAYSGTHR